MSMSEDRSASDLRLTPYQLTLSALIVPWRLHMLLNAVTGVAFGLVAGPALAMLWVACLTLGDAILQGQYGRLKSRAAVVDSDRGLRRLAWIGAVKGVPLDFGADRVCRGDAQLRRPGLRRRDRHPANGARSIDLS
jgi:hypothetical protein